MAKPSCMPKTRLVEKRRKVESTAKAVSRNLLETTSKWPQMNSAVSEALVALPSNAVKSVADQVRGIISGSPVKVGDGTEKCSKVRS
ncbi:hypothetical protein U1Q18_044975 [Sarracenia purpurea var. burkii]